MPVDFQHYSMHVAHKFSQELEKSEISSNLKLKATRDKIKGGFQEKYGKKKEIICNVASIEENYFTES